MGVADHRHGAPSRLRIAVVSVSTTRSLAEDESGHWIGRQVGKNGHDLVWHQVVPDDAAAIRDHLSALLADAAPDAVLISGGTGIDPADVTIEAVRPLFDKELTAFGVLFTQLSFDQIDSAALLSRATAGVMGTCLVFCMPGSLKACQLACNQLIFPEIGHMAKHLRVSHPSPKAPDRDRNAPAGET